MARPFGSITGDENCVCGPSSEMSTGQTPFGSMTPGPRLTTPTGAGGSGSIPEGSWVGEVQPWQPEGAMTRQEFIRWSLLPGDLRHIYWTSDMYQTVWNQ
jgi:hypothetical protein